MKHSEFLFGAKIQQLVSKYGATTFSTSRKSPLNNRFLKTPWVRVPLPYLRKQKVPVKQNERIAKAIHPRNER
jgi:hypothetical protein